MYTTKVGIHIGYCMTFPDFGAFFFSNSPAVDNQSIWLQFGRRVLITYFQGNNNIFL